MIILPSTTSTSMSARLFVVVFFKKGALTLKGLKDLHKTIRGTAKKCENKNLT